MLRSDATNKVIKNDVIIKKAVAYSLFDISLCHYHKKNCFPFYGGREKQIETYKCTELRVRRRSRCAERNCVLLCSLHWLHFYRGHLGNWSGHNEWSLYQNYVIPIFVSFDCGCDCGRWHCATVLNVSSALFIDKDIFAIILRFQPNLSFETWKSSPSKLTFALRCNFTAFSEDRLFSDFSH